MTKRYIVRLSEDERFQLNELVQSGRIAAYKRLHAQILLKADIGTIGPGWNDARIAEAFDISIRTVERVRERLCLNGLDAAIDRAVGSGKARTFDGVQEAHLIALACSNPPEGYARWTLRLLADQFVRLEYIDSVSHETVRQVLKKMK